MKNVLLIIQPKTEDAIGIINFMHEHCPYAILLVGQPYIWRRRVINAPDIEGKPKVKIYDREQACICYWSEKELTDNKGTYQEYLPEEVEDNLFMYDAKLV